MNAVVLRADGSAIRSGQRRPQTFDTHGDGAGSLAAFLDGLEDGTIILLAAKDDASAKLTAEAEAAIARCGGARARDVNYRDAYALIGVKNGVALAETFRTNG